jgi:hypothetical protein
MNGSRLFFSAFSRGVEPAFTLKSSMEMRRRLFAYRAFLGASAARQGTQVIASGWC